MRAGLPFHSLRWALDSHQCSYPLPAPRPPQQAMADYATLIGELQEQLAEPDAPVIGFGGSCERHAVADLLGRAAAPMRLLHDLAQ